VASTTAFDWWQQPQHQQSAEEADNSTMSSTVTTTAKNKVLYNLQSTSGDGFSDSDNTNKVSGDSNHNS